MMGLATLWVPGWRPRVVHGGLGSLHVYMADGRISSFHENAKEIHRANKGIYRRKLIQEFINEIPR